MNKQFDFLRQERLTVIFINCWIFLSTLSFKKIILTNFLFSILLLLGTNDVFGQTINLSLNPAPANICAEVPHTLSVTPTNVPIVWSSLNGTGVFSDATSPNASSIKYMPNPVNGSTRTDLVIATLDEGYPAQWFNPVGIDTMGGSFVCTIDGQGNSGARSQNILPVNTSGWVEAKYGVAVQSVFGLSIAIDAHSIDPNTIDFGIQVSNTTQNKAFVIENGTFPADAPSIDLVAGNDIFRVERIGNTIVYKHNRVVFYTSTINTNLSLAVDASMFNSGDALDMDVSFGDNTQVFPADTISLNVLKAVSIDIGPDLEICQGEEATLALTFDGSLFDRWEHPNGSFDDNTLIYTHNPISGGDRIDEVIAYTQAAPNGVCPVVSDTAIITIRQAPTISTPSLANNPICEEDSVLITAMPGGNSDSIFWTTNTGVFNITNGITDDTNTSIYYFPNRGLTTATRIDKLYLETDNDVSVCPTTKDTLDIMVHWADSIYNTFTLAEICEGDSIEMQAIRVKGAIGNDLTWSIFHNTGILATTTTAADSNAIYIPNLLTQGDAVRFDTLIVTTIPSGTPTCDAFVDTVIVKVFEIDEVTASVGPFEICEGDSITIDAMLGGAATAVLWTNPSGNGIFIDEDSLATIYIPNDISTTDLTRKDTLIVTTLPLTSCVPAVDTVVVNLYKIPQLTLSQDTTICLLDTATIHSLSPRGSIDYITRWDTLASGIPGMLPSQINDTTQYLYTSAVPIVFPDLSRTDTIIAATNPTSITGGGMCLIATDTVVITIIDTASISIVAASDTICEGEMTHLDSIKAVIHSGATGVTWKLIPAHSTRGTLTSVDSVTARYMPNDINDNTTVSRNDTLMAISTGLLGCQPDTAYVEVVIFNGVSLDPISDVTLCNGNNRLLRTTIRGIGNFTAWQVSSSTATGTFSGQTTSNTAASQRVTYFPAIVDPRTTPRIDNIKFSASSTSSFCPDFRDSLDITINPSHLVEITTAGIAGTLATDPDTLVVCEGETLATISGTRGNGTKNIEWFSNTGTFNNPTASSVNFSTSYTPDIGQSNDIRLDTIYLRSTNSVLTCTAAEDIIIVKVNKAAALSNVTDKVVCETSTITLTAVSTGFGDSLFWNILQSRGTFVNMETTDTTTTAQNSVVYQPNLIASVSAQLRVDTIIYATVDPEGICPAVEDTVLVTVYNAPTVEVADPNKSIDTAFICEGVGLALDGRYGGGAIGATWSVVNGTGIISNILSGARATYTPNQGVIGTQRVDTLILTTDILAGTCTNLVVSDTLYVIVQEGPVVMALVDSLTMCEGDTIDIAGTFASAATGFTWSTKVAGSGTIDTLTSTTAKYSPVGTITSPGRLDVIYLTSNNGSANCLQAIDSIEIFVSAKPILELGPDVSLCGELTQVLTPQNAGVNNQLTWTSTDGTFATNPSPTGLYQPDFTIPTFNRPDGIIVTSIDSLGLCTAIQDTMLVTVFGLARISIGAAGTICEEDTIALNTAFAGTINDFTYTVSNNDGVVEVNNNQLFYVPNENTTQSNRVDQIILDLGDVDGAGTCPSIMDTIDITILNTPRAILVSDTTICAGDQVNLLVETFGLIDTFSSTFSTSLVNYPNTPPTLIGGVLTDTIIYGTRLINNACPADLTQVTVTIKEVGTIALNLSDTTICEANALALDAGLSNPDDYTIQWGVVGNMGVFDADDIATPVYTPNTGLATTARIDTLILTVVDASNICNVGADTLLVTVVPSATLEALSDTTICEGEVLNLSATVNGAAAFFWASNSGTFADSTMQQTTYTHAPVNGGNGLDLLTANISFVNGTCTNVQQTMRVTVIGQIEVDAGNDTEICTGSTIQLEGALSIGIDSAEWLILNNAGTVDVSNSLNAIYTPSPNTGTTDRIDVLILNTASSLSCAVPIDTLLITVKPTPTVDIGADQIHMGTPDLIFTAITSEVVEVGQWHAVNGNFTNSTVNQTVYIPNDLAEGEIRLDTIIYTADFGIAGCQLISDTLVLTFEAPPAIGREMNEEFCKSLCIDTAGANIDIMTGEAVILANDIEPFDTCLARTDLAFRFWYPELGVPEPLNIMDFPSLPDSVVYDCTDRGAQNINVYVASDSMNIQLCPAVIKVEDSFFTCGERTVAGRITTFRGEPVEGFQVFVENAGAVGGVVPDPVLTDADGRYSLTLNVNQTFRIVPKNNEDSAEGVTAFDNVVISRHILGIEPFVSPFQTIAADVNKSGSVTAFDIVLIRKVVLARDEFFENNTSWRFIDADFEFTDIVTAANAPFMESFLVTENMGNVTDMDFIAVKVGDANGTVNPNGLGVLEVDARNSEAIVFQTTDLSIEKDKTYAVPFQLLNSTDVAGYQFTLDFDGLELQDIEAGIASKDNFGLTLQNRGLLMTAWSTGNPISTNKAWFTLHFKANKAGVLSEMLALNSVITPVEGITINQQAVGVQLDFVASVTSTFDLFQNNPNPFKNSTTIGFTLPEASTGQLTILDVQGKEMQVIKGRYEAGYNAETIDLSELPKGVFYYRLETAFGTKVQKMMHLE